MQPPSSERRYRILGLLGEGGFGRVYLARMEAPDFRKDVALKILDLASHSEELIGRFRDEARLLGLVRDRAIVSSDGLVCLDGRWTVVMEYVEGFTLSQVIRAHGALPVSVALEIIGEIARALNKVYDHPGPDGRPLRLLHRDLKPANLRITAYGEVKILDFGIARADFSDREANTRRAVVGTSAYMAPERFEGIEEPSGDVYSLGVVLEEMVLGSRASSRGPSDPTATASPSLKAAQQLAQEMTRRDRHARPTARDVEHRCEVLRTRWDSPSLRSFCEQNLAEMQLEIVQDARSGEVLSDGPPPGVTEGSVLSAGSFVPPEASAVAVPGAGATSVGEERATETSAVAVPRLWAAGVGEVRDSEATAGAVPPVAPAVPPAAPVAAAAPPAAPVAAVPPVAPAAAVPAVPPVAPAAAVPPAAPVAPVAPVVPVAAAAVLPVAEERAPEAAAVPPAEDAVVGEEHASEAAAADADAAGAEEDSADADADAVPQRRFGVVGVVGAIGAIGAVGLGAAALVGVGGLVVASIVAAGVWVWPTEDEPDRSIEVVPTAGPPIRDPLGDDGGGLPDPEPVALVPRPRVDLRLGMGRAAMLHIGMDPTALRVDPGLEVVPSPPYLVVLAKSLGSATLTAEHPGGETSWEVFVDRDRRVDPEGGSDLVGPSELLELTLGIGVVCDVGSPPDTLVLASEARARVDEILPGLLYIEGREAGLVDLVMDLPSESPLIFALESSEVGGTALPAGCVAPPADPVYGEVGREQQVSTPLDAVHLMVADPSLLQVRSMPDGPRQIALTPQAKGQTTLVVSDGTEVWIRRVISR